MRALRVAIALLVLGFAPGAWAQCSSYLAAGYLQSGYLTDGYLVEHSCVAVPNVVGEANAEAAELVLEADGFVLGNVVAACSVAPLDEVIRQRPAAGTLAELGTAVDLRVSSGMECKLSNDNRIAIKIGIGL